MLIIRLAASYWFMIRKVVDAIKRNMESFLLISAGAIVGANARYWLQDWAVQRLGPAFPFGTLLINITGSLLLGFFMTIATERFLVDPRTRVMVSLGVLSSYTTFSTYAYESIALIMGGQWSLGLLNLLGSMALGLLAVAAGITLGRLI